MSVNVCLLLVESTIVHSPFSNTNYLYMEVGTSITELQHIYHQSTISPQCVTGLSRTLNIETIVK